MNLVPPCPVIGLLQLVHLRPMIIVKDDINVKDCDDHHDNHLLAKSSPKQLAQYGLSSLMFVLISISIVIVLIISSALSSSSSLILILCSYIWCVECLILHMVW